MIKEFNDKIGKEIIQKVDKDILEFGKVKDKDKVEEIEKVIEKIKEDALEIGKVLYQDPQKKN